MLVYQTLWNTGLIKNASDAILQTFHNSLFSCQNIAVGFCTEITFLSSYACQATIP